MAEGTRMKTLEDSVKKTEALLQHMQQLFATTQQISQDSTKRRAETDLKVDTPTELVKKVIAGSERLPFVANPGDAAGAGLEKLPRVEGQDPQISATEGSDQGRIPNPRTGNAGADDFKHHSTHPTIFPTKNSQAPSNDIDVFPTIEGTGDLTIFWGINIDSERPKLFKKFGTERDGRASSQKLGVEPKDYSEVITYPLEIVVEVESDEIDGTQEVLTANRKNLFDGRMNLSEFLGIPSVHKVFVKMPKRGVQLVTGLRRVSFDIESNQDFIKVPYDRGKLGEALAAYSTRVLPDSCVEGDNLKRFVFDPGGIYDMYAVQQTKSF